MWNSTFSYILQKKVTNLGMAGELKMVQQSGEQIDQKLQKLQYETKKFSFTQIKMHQQWEI